MKKPPQRMTEMNLDSAALFYLSRYASSSGNLRRVLAQKIRRSAAFYGDDPAVLLGRLDPLVAKYLGSGAIDDSLYAEAQTRKLRRRGGSGRAIQQRLAAKGVPSDAIAVAALGLADAADDREAALRLARRRRLGPFRGAERAEHRLRDLAALGRAGFAYPLAVEIIDADPEQDPAA